MSAEGGIRMRIPLAARGLLCACIVFTPLACLANTVLWGSVEVSPSSIVLRCKWSDSVQDRQTRESIANQPGIVGNIKAVTNRMAQMTGVGYRSSGAPGKEVLELNFHYSGIFEQPVKLSARMVDDTFHLYLRSAGKGKGGIVAKDRDAVRRLLKDENKRRVTEDYRQWQARFNGEIGRLQNKFADYSLALDANERRALQRDLRGQAKASVRIGACSDDVHEVQLSSRWERPLGAGKKK
jgi:hypothetical protein